jgi:hypothetical protein
MGVGGGVNVGRGIGVGARGVVFSPGSSLGARDGMLPSTEGRGDPPGLTGGGVKAGSAPGGRNMPGTELLGNFGESVVLTLVGDQTTTAAAQHATTPPAIT